MLNKSFLLTMIWIYFIYYYIYVSASPTNYNIKFEQGEILFIKWGISDINLLEAELVQKFWYAVNIWIML